MVELAWGVSAILLRYSWTSDLYFNDIHLQTCALSVVGLLLYALAVQFVANTSTSDQGFKNLKKSTAMLSIMAMKHPSFTSGSFEGGPEAWARLYANFCEVWRSLANSGEPNATFIRAPRFARIDSQICVDRFEGSPTEPLSYEPRFEAPKIVRSGKLQNESVPNFSNFRPKIPTIFQCKIPRQKRKKYSQNSSGEQAK